MKKYRVREGSIADHAITAGIFLGLFGAIACGETFVEAVVSFIW